MESPALSYQKNMRDRPEMKGTAYKYFFDKYFKDPFHDNGLFDTNERASAKNIKLFIPGKIYTFQYNPITKDVLDYYDRRPIILCCGQWTAESTGNTIVTGINFNFLPEVARVNTLEYYYQSVKDDIDDAYAKTEKTGQVSFIKRALAVLQDVVKMVNVFNKSGQIGYQFAMRNYIVGPNMRQNVLVEYDDWQWIPFIQTKDIVGKSLGDIYREYLSERNALAKKQPPIIRPGDKRQYKNR
jgi:hypothetical protein